MKTIIPIVAATFLLAAPVTAQEAITEGDLVSIDLSGDSVVTEAEYLAYMDQVFAKLDANGNGVLQASELSTILTPEQIAATDTRGNGTISRAEFDARVKADFEAADRDGNGSLN